MSAKKNHLVVKFKINLLLNFFSVILLLALPYYIFEGKLFIGGDDTRLFYAYPFEFLKNVTYFSWYNVSSIGINTSNQYLIPFLSIWTLLDSIIRNKIILSYFGFSLPLVLGFLYFKKFVKELFDFGDKDNIELSLGSLFFILSPIIILDQLFIFLTPVWLLGMVPAVGYYYLKYLKHPNFRYVFYAMIISLIFSFAILAIPWLLSYILPMILASFVLALFSKRTDILVFLKRSAAFFLPILLAQSFWFLGFIAPYLIRDNTSFAARFLSKGFLDTFAPTIIATATGNILYPLLNLYHRQIAFDFDWKLKNEFINVYDKTIVLNLIFIFILTIGLIHYKKYLEEKNKKIFLLILLSFIISLYFFTVNIGPLRDFFIQLGKIPGFVMFRNFYDKFAPGYVFLYSTVITVCLIIVKNKFVKNYKYINLLMLIVILINFSTVKSTVNSPLWTTKSVFKTITIPDEYLNFMKKIENDVSSTNNILSVPLGSSVYTVIKDDKTDNVYVGTSPVKVFSGVNDISGYLSFLFSKEADKFDKIISERDYKELNEILYKHNINYVLITKNIPLQVLKSYAFNQNTLVKQDKIFLDAILGKKLATSNNGNYELYTTKRMNSLLKSKDLTFKKINSIQYKLYIKNLRHQRNLEFNDSFHYEWKLFLQKNPNLHFCKKTIAKVNDTRECSTEFKFFDPKELSFLWKKPIFNNTHSTIDGTTNSWKINSDYIKKNFSKDYYIENADGTIDIEMIMYFNPQLYLYYGSIISVTVLLISGIYLFLSIKKK